MRNICLLFVGILFGFVFSAQGQISVPTINSGPYGVGSSITVPINFTNNQSEFKIGNVFTLYISDAAGVFAGNGTQIGQYNGFFTPGINGVIPNLPDGSGYRLRIVASNPATTIEVSGPIIIKNNSFDVTLTPSFPTNNLGGDNLGWCPSGARNGNSIVLRSNAPTGSIVTVELKNLITGTITNYTEVLPLGVTIPNIDIGYYALTVTAITVVAGENIKSTKTYHLHNTQLLVNIIDNGTTIGCINAQGGGANIIFPIGFAGGISTNDPSTIYSISWGDGSSEQKTIYEIKQNAESISHVYTTTSCGQPTIPGPPDILNSFKATIAAINQYSSCNESRSTTGYAQVFLNPEARITPPSSVGCLNASMRFINSTIAGNRSNCSTQMDYSWFVDGNLVKQSSTNDPLDYVFTTKGNHIIKLIASNGVGSCTPSETSITVCIQEPPKPAFDITTPTTGCAPFLVEISDKSFIDPSCVSAPAPTYNWIVTNANGVRFTNFNTADPNPKILFTDPGVYSIVLEISSGACGVVRSAAGTPIVIINGQPTITLAPDTKLCRLGSYLFDNIPGTPTQTIFTGTQVDLADTYTWTVTDINGNVLTSADYSFDPGSNPNSKHPSINFKRNIPYLITVTHKNTCASVTRSQRIEFVSAPTINLGADQNICFTQGSVNLEANVIGNVLSGKWEGGLGTFSTPNNTTTTYTPTAAERASGLITLKYTVTTDLQQPCTSVSAEIKIFVKPEIKITSSATKTICTGASLSYAPAANLPNTSFTWTATGTANAGGFNNATSPSFLINDILTNSDPTNNATVTYIITPMNDGCNGVPFTFTVTVAPKPILTATLASPIICSGKLSGITLTPNLPGTTFNWISTATGGVTGNSQNATVSNVNAINDLLINNGTAQGTVTYTITPTSINGCEGAPVTVTITVEPALTIPNAGLDDEICIVSSYTLKGNPITTGSGLWTEVTTFGATFVDATSPITQVDNLIAGNTYIFRWTVTGASACDPISDEVSITRNQPSVGGTTSSNIPVVCAGTNSGTITLTDHIGTIIRWESCTDGTSWTAINNTTTTLTFTNINIATSYRAVVQSGACAIANSAITTINTNTAAVVATAGVDQTLCNQTSIQLNGNDPGTNAGMWTVVSGQTVNFADATLFNTQVSGLAGGEIYTFRWTITGLAPCPATSDDVTIFNSAILQNNTITTPSTTACTNQIITLTGTTPTGGNGVFAYVWESSNDGTNWTVINGQINRDLNLTVAGSLSYRRTVNSGSCTSVSEIIIITALPPVGNNTITADQVICETANPAIINGSQPTGGDGTIYSYAWEQSTDGVTWTFVPAADGKDFQPPLLTQTTNFRRLVSSAACAGTLQSISNPIKITVNQNARAEYTYVNNVGCAPFIIDATNVKAVAYPAQNTTYTWYANGAQIGNTITFPGYTIATDNQTVEIKLVTTSVLGCSDAEVAYIFSTRQSITAAFTQDKIDGCGPLDVNFTNTSTQLTGATFKWDFGNGTTSNLTQPGAIQFLADPAGEDKIYTVTLEVTTPCGTNAFSSTVTVKPNPISIFSPNKTSGCSPFTVQFSNTSPGNNNTFTYDFGDGSPTVITNNKNSVTHTFTTTTVQDFIVKMTATNDCGTSESQYTIKVAPNTITPELVVNANQLRGCAPLSVDFFNNTIGASFYRYTFGDGSVITSNNNRSEKQTHVFTRPGVYTVELFATNGCSEATTTETITVLPQPLVSFIAETTTGCVGLAVKFKNLSQDGVSYLWDFGDGTTSTSFEPTHTYQGPANTYTVSLTAVNALGCPKTFAIPNYIRIVPPPRADFNVDPASIISIPLYTFKFTDASTNGAQTYKWSFGDGAESTLKDPTHLYADTGKYLVTMRTYNEFGCVDSLQKTVQIVGVPGYVYLPNSFIPGGTSSPLQKFMAVGSGIKSWRMQIFNKWGQVVWETTQLEDGKPVEGWDGTYKGVPQPQGIYFWKLDVELINGTEWKGMTYDSKAPKRTGEIYLIR